MISVRHAQTVLHLPTAVLPVVGLLIILTTDGRSIVPRGVSRDLLTRGHPVEVARSSKVRSRQPEGR